MDKIQRTGEGEKDDDGGGGLLCRLAHVTGEGEKDDDGVGGLLCRLAHLILPQLDPPALASISSTCKALHLVSKAITSTRISDASTNLENYPIPFFNSLDSQLYPYFIYSPVQTLPGESGRVRTDPFLFRVEGAQGCDCENCELVDSHSNCSCVDLTRECGPSCGCGSECGNRVTQRGISVKLKVVKDRRKGWSLCAHEFIPKGKFICEYAGSLGVTSEVAAM